MRWPGRGPAPPELGASTWAELAIPERVVDDGTARLWRGFMAARLIVAAILLLLLVYLYAHGQVGLANAVFLCAGYFAATMAAWLLSKPEKSDSLSGKRWFFTVGLDVLVFSCLLFMPLGGINFTPLFALPVLLAAVLGSLLLALGTAATVTLVLLSDAWWLSLQGFADPSPRYLQAALTSSGLFLVAYLVHQLALRLARQERLARTSAMMARVQIEVNQLVIDTLSDGLLVVDSNGVVRAANPAARSLLGVQRLPGDTPNGPFLLAAQRSWHPLIVLADETYATRSAQQADIDLVQGGQTVRKLHVHTRMAATNALGGTDDQLCVLFLEDLREMEARLRTEKLAAMGRMSAAVAHEIRNPLSAIAQANALLAEDLQSEQHLQLTQMVHQNTQRLSRIVDDILDVARAKSIQDSRNVLINSGQMVLDMCTDWAQQNMSSARLLVPQVSAQHNVIFEQDHLHRVLINLLDNAARYASQDVHSIQVTLRTVNEVATPTQALRLSIWSDGAPIEQGVQSHLFEPFFSSESRSSGLGLYISRELCERHGASIQYQRSRRVMPDVGERSGNEFVVLLVLADTSEQKTVYA